jgi:serine/threonine-protein kinase
MAKIGSYEIVETLQGGQKPLYKVKAADGAILALKVMPATGVAEEEKQRFQREGEVARELDHPNLLLVKEVGEADGVLYQAMDLLEGMDLRKTLATGKAIAWERKLEIMDQVCDGLAFAHEKGLVHRDIKPANIFIETSGRVRVFDFGMARVQASNLTRAGAAVGTLNYMAPEQLRGERCSAASDVFAAAVVFYELSSGRHPFSFGESNLAKVLSNIMFLAPAPLNTLAPDAPEGLNTALMRALEKDPAKRLQSANELKSALAICKLTLGMGPGLAEPVASAAPSPAEAQEYEKTKVIRRTMVGAAQAPSKPVAAAPAPTPAPVAQRPVAVAPKQELIYCSSCTHPNTPGSLMCARCGLPLAAAPMPEAPKQGGSMNTLVVALLVAVVVLLLVIVYLKVSG